MIYDITAGVLGWISCHVLGHHDTRVRNVGLLQREVCQRDHCVYLGHTIIPTFFEK